MENQQGEILCKAKVAVGRARQKTAGGMIRSFPNRSAPETDSRACFSKEARMRVVPRAEQIEGSRQFSLRHPCGECPFSRQCTPGGTGGADPTVYVGQAQGAFWLPCHMDKDYNKESALDNAGMIAQCAGAAVYRANVGIDARIPSALLHLPEDHFTV